MKRFTFWLYIFLSTSALLAGFEKILQKNWASFGMSILTLIFMSLPFLIEKRFRIEFPREFISVLLLFFYASMFLGTANHFFVLFWWWDKMLHGFSGLIFANLGFLITMYLNRSQKLNSMLGRISAALFSFCFAVASGAIWEIYEYSMDKSFGSLYQGVGIDDTMIDIIFDTLGALIFTLFLFQGKGKLKLITEDKGKSEVSK